MFADEKFIDASKPIQAEASIEQVTSTHPQFSSNLIIYTIMIDCFFQKRELGLVEQPMNIVLTQ